MSPDPIDPTVIPVPQLAAGGTAADDIPGLDAPPPEPEPGPAKRRRRRRKTAEPAVEGPPPPPSPEDVALLAVALSMGFGTVFDLVAARRGPHWALTAGEREQLAEPWAQALAPYMGRVAAYTPWAMAGLATFALVAPRMAEDAALAAGAPSGTVESPRAAPGPLGPIPAKDSSVSQPGIPDSQPAGPAPAAGAPGGSPVPIDPPKRRRGQS